MAAPQIAKSPNGQWYELVNNEWRDYTGITPEDTAFAQTRRSDDPGVGFGQGVADALGGDYWGPSLLGVTDNQYQAMKQQQHEDTPFETIAGTLGTGVAASVLAGPSALAQIGTGAGLGAALDSEDPLQGALVGGVLGGIAPGAQSLARNADAIIPAVGNAIEGGLTRIADAADVAAGGTMAQRVVHRMTGGIGNSLGIAGRSAPGAPPGGVYGSALMQQGEEGGMVLQGFLNPDEAATMGLPLTYGDELALKARTGEELAHAKRVRMAEELKRTDRLAGAGIERVREAQKDWATTQVKNRLGLSGEPLLTVDVLGAKLNQLGSEFDQFADDIGSVPLTGDVITQLDDIVEGATGTHGGAITRLVEDAKKMAAQNDGALSGQDWQLLRTRLGKMLEAGARNGDYGKVGDATALREILVDMMETSLPAASREALATTRSQYGLVKTLLSRIGNLSDDGRVNSRSLYGAMRTAGRIRNRADDSLLRMLETDRFLTDRILPSSGTAERLLANPGRALIQGGIGTGVLGGAGAGASLLLGD